MTLFRGLDEHQSLVHAVPSQQVSQVLKGNLAAEPVEFSLHLAHFSQWKGNTGVFIQFEVGFYRIGWRSLDDHPPVH